MNVSEAKTAGELQQWDKYVLKQTAYPFGALSNWKKIFENNFGYKCFYLTAKDNSDIQGILPLVLINSVLYQDRFLISVPFNPYAGIISSSVEAKNLLLAKAVDIAKQHNVNRLEIRQNYENNDIKSISSEHCNQVIELADTAEAQWKEFRSTIRNRIRKAEKNEMSVEVGHHLVDEFYTVYSRNMRDLAFPVFDKKYFLSILSNFKEQINITIVRKGTPVGCMLTFSAGDTIADCYVSTIREYNKYYPNNLLYWTVLKSAIETGFKYFDFGRSQHGSGTFDFKKRWGAKEQTLYYHYPYHKNASIPSVRNEAKKLNIAMNIWERLPLSVANFFGPFVRKNIPF